MALDLSETQPNEKSHWSKIGKTPRVRKYDPITMAKQVIFKLKNNNESFAECNNPQNRIIMIHVWKIKSPKKSNFKNSSNIKRSLFLK